MARQTDPIYFQENSVPSNLFDGLNVLDAWDDEEEGSNNHKTKTILRSDNVRNNQYEDKLNQALEKTKRNMQKDKERQISSNEALCVKKIGNIKESPIKLHSRSRFPSFGLNSLCKRSLKIRKNSTKIQPSSNSSPLMDYPSQYSGSIDKTILHHRQSSEKLLDTNDKEQFHHSPPRYSRSRSPKLTHAEIWLRNNNYEHKHRSLPTNECKPRNAKGCLKELANELEYYDKKKKEILQDIGLAVMDIDISKRKSSVDVTDSLEKLVTRSSSSNFDLTARINKDRGRSRSRSRSQRHGRSVSSRSSGSEENLDEDYNENRRDRSISTPSRRYSQSGPPKMAIAEMWAHKQNYASRDRVKYRGVSHHSKEKSTKLCDANKKKILEELSQALNRPVPPNYQVPMPTQAFNMQTPMQLPAHDYYQSFPPFIYPPLQYNRPLLIGQPNSFCNYNFNSAPNFVPRMRFQSNPIPNTVPYPLNVPTKPRFHMMQRSAINSISDMISQPGNLPINLNPVLKMAPQHLNSNKKITLTLINKEKSGAANVVAPTGYQTKEERNGASTKVVKDAINQMDMPWVTNTVKQMIQIKNEAYEKFKDTKLMSDWDHYDSLTYTTSEAIKAEKLSYLNKNLDELVPKSGAVLDADQSKRLISKSGPILYIDDRGAPVTNANDDIVNNKCSSSNAHQSYRDIIEEHDLALSLPSIRDISSLSKNLSLSTNKTEPTSPVPSSEENLMPLFLEDYYEQSLSSEHNQSSLQEYNSLCLPLQLSSFTKPNRSSLTPELNKPLPTLTVKPLPLLSIINEASLLKSGVPPLVSPNHAQLALPPHKSNQFQHTENNANKRKWNAKVADQTIRIQFKSGLPVNHQLDDLKVIESTQFKNHLLQKMDIAAPSVPNKGLKSMLLPPVDSDGLSFLRAPSPPVISHDNIEMEPSYEILQPPPPPIISNQNLSNKRRKRHRKKK